MLSVSITSVSAPISGLAPGSVQDYSQWVHLVSAMLRGGFTPEEAGNNRRRQLHPHLPGRRRLTLRLPVPTAVSSGRMTKRTREDIGRPSA